jgi:hypothetical protein
VGHRRLTAGSPDRVDGPLCSALRRSAAGGFEEYPLTPCVPRDDVNRRPWASVGSSVSAFSSGPWLRHVSRESGRVGEGGRASLSFTRELWARSQALSTSSVSVSSDSNWKCVPPHDFVQPGRGDRLAPQRRTTCGATRSPPAARPVTPSRRRRRRPRRRRRGPTSSAPRTTCSRSCFSPPPSSCWNEHETGNAASTPGAARLRPGHLRRDGRVDRNLPGQHLDLTADARERQSSRTRGIDRGCLGCAAHLARRRPPR